MPKSTVEIILKAQGYIGPYQVAGRSSIANLFGPKKRCGIYVLHFANDEHYVGQSVDVVRRYSDHRKNHTDIERISFKVIPEIDLDQEEKNLIAALEHQFPLRNISLTTFYYGDSDFDQIMSTDEQNKWL